MAGSKMLGAPAMASFPHATLLPPQRRPNFPPPSTGRLPNLPFPTFYLRNAIHGIHGFTCASIRGEHGLRFGADASRRVFWVQFAAASSAEAAVEEAVEPIDVGERGNGTGEAKFGRVLETLGRSRTLETLDAHGDEGDGDAGASFTSGWESSERVLGCCERGETLKVAVLVSGGVDSSVALRLLCAAGHSCTAFYLKIWFQEDFENFWSECPWDEDLKYAQAVCDEAGVELRVVHFTDEYWKLVVSHSISEIQAGRTPNPDILCNSCIKFGAFLEHIKDAQFDRVASGHYARVRRILGSDGGGEARTKLCLSADEVKDQTYFLSYLRQEQLSRLMFPLGGLSKVEVRQLAEAMGLFNKHRKDSQGICFLGKVKFSEFIAKHLGEREGRLLEAENGELLGLHRGFWFYTMGQRQGLGLSNGPWFVVAKDVVNNVVFISRKYYSEDKRRRAFRVSSFNWFSGSPPADTSSLQCKVRHGARLYDCCVSFEHLQTDSAASDPNTSAVVNLNEDDQGLAPGQYAAFYRAGVCLGSAVITEALGGAENLSVAERALESARQPFDVAAYKSSKPKVSSSLKVISESGNLPRKSRVRSSKSDLEKKTGTPFLVQDASVGVDEDVSEEPVRIETRRDYERPGWTGFLPRFLQAFLPK